MTVRPNRQLGLASLTEKGVQPRTSHRKLYRFYVTAMSPTGRQEEKKAPMFGIWQGSGPDFSFLPRELCRTLAPGACIFWCLWGKGNNLQSLPFA